MDMDVESRTNEENEIMSDIARTDYAAIKAAGRDVVQQHIDGVWSLEEYLAYLNNDNAPGDFGLVSDTEHWAEMGVTTAPQLADHLDGACARNVEKSERY